MTEEFALDFIPGRMLELGYGKNYIKKLRHLQLAPSEILKIDADNEYFYLINPSDQIAVRSKFGVYDLADTALDEMKYEHKGKIQIKNKSIETQFVLFIQVIPNHH